MKDKKTKTQTKATKEDVVIVEEKTKAPKEKVAKEPKTKKEKVAKEPKAKKEISKADIKTLDTFNSALDEVSKAVKELKKAIKDTKKCVKSKFDFKAFEKTLKFKDKVNSIKF